MKIEVKNVRPSSCVDTAGAVDAEVTVRDGGAVVAEGEVTLCPSDYDGRISSWGTRSHWCTEGLHGLSPEALQRIELAVQAAAEEP